MIGRELGDDEGRGADGKRAALSHVSRRLLLGLEVVEEDGALLGVLTPVLDDDARAVDDLAGVALTVNLACFLISLDSTSERTRFSA